MTQALQRQSGAGSDPIIRLVVTHWILGALTGIGCALLLLSLDVAGLRSLLLRSDFLWTGLLLLCSGFAITFGGVISASAVMMVPVSDANDPDAGSRADAQNRVAAQATRTEGGDRHHMGENAVTGAHRAGTCGA